MLKYWFLTDSQNICPLFLPEQLSLVLRASDIPKPQPSQDFTLDLGGLTQNIENTTFLELLAAKLLATPPINLSPPWSRNTSGQLFFQNCLYVPDITDLCLWALHTFHDHTLADHLGQTKTQQLIQHEFAWPKLRTFVADFVCLCNSCGRNKSRQHKPYEPLSQLPILPQPWESISMDFIKQLPPSEGYTNILVIMDCLTKQAIFVPIHNTTDAQMLADVFILDVFSKHSIPSHVTLDQGPKFVLMFFRSLATTLQMRLYFILGHYPEANSQSKRTNQTLEQYLHLYCNYQQDNWAKLLLLVKFTFNNMSLSSTGILPFFANKCYYPRLQVRSLPDLVSELAKTYSSNLDAVLTNLKQMLADSQVHYQTHTDAHWAIPPRIEVEDSVFVLAKSIRTTRPSMKLSECYLEPFGVTSKPSAHLYQIKFPQHLQAIHLVFHISQP